MVFVEWRSISFLSLSLGGAALSSLAILRVRNKSRKIKIPITVICTITLLTFSAFTLLFCFFVSVDNQNHSRGIYSPDRKEAARVESWGGFGTSYGASVRVYRWRGFRSDLVFVSDGETPDVGDVVWKDDHHMIIRFSKEDDDFECINAHGVSVQCVPKPLQ
jgi:hypothetical protein